MAATDVYDAHTYEQDPTALAPLLAGLAEGRSFINDRDGKAFSVSYRGQPYFVSEYGGVWWKELGAEAGAPARTPAARGATAYGWARSRSGTSGSPG